MDINQTEANNWQNAMLGRYQLLRLLGRGGAGEVWYASDTQMGRAVAIKLLPATPVTDDSALQDFEREGRAIASLEHPHILPIHDVGQQQVSRDEVVTYLVMAYVTGGSLRDRLLTANGPLPFEEAISYLRQAGEAIDFAHSRNVLHRDIKPANMLLQQDWLYLADFGLAKLLTSTTQRSKTHAGDGTPEYMAPEQAQAKAEPASDRYSFAVTAYQLLTGRVPFKGETPYSTLLQHISAPPPSPRQFNPALSQGVEQALLQGLAKEPQERPASCLALVNALERANSMGLLANADPDATILASWSNRKIENAQPTAMSAPSLQQSLTPATPATPFVYGPTPVIGPSARSEVAEPQGLNEQNTPTYISSASEMPLPAREAPPPERPQHKVSRRTLLLAGSAAVLVVAGGAVGTYALIRSHANTSPAVVKHPKPVPGPKKLVEGVALLSIAGHTKEVNVSRWDPAGRYLATGGEDARVMLWDITGSIPKNATTIQSVTTPSQSWRVPTAVFSQSLGWSNNGHTLAVVTGNSQISLIDASKSGSTVQPYQDAILSHSTNPPAYSFIAWSPTANTFAVPSFIQQQTQQQVNIWQLGHPDGPVRKLISDTTATPRTQIIDYIHPFNQYENLNGVDWSLDGTQVAAHTNFGTVTIWQAATGVVKQSLMLPKRPTKDNPLYVLNELVAWSPTDPNILAASNIEVITIWNVQKNQLLLTLKPDYAFPFTTGLAWAPNGKHIAATYAGSGKVRIWDVQTTASNTEVLPRLLFPKAGVTVQRQTLTDVSWSPDGRYIASASGDGTVVVWKVDAS